MSRSHAIRIAGDVFSTSVLVRVVQLYAARWLPATSVMALESVGV
jgi:hypothetical protein